MPVENLASYPHETHVWNLARVIHLKQFDRNKKLKGMRYDGENLLFIFWCDFVVTLIFSTLFNDTISGD